MAEETQQGEQEGTDDSNDGLEGEFASISDDLIDPTTIINEAAMDALCIDFHTPARMAHDSLLSTISAAMGPMEFASMIEDLEGRTDALAELADTEALAPSGLQPEDFLTDIETDTLDLSAVDVPTDPMMTESMAAMLDPPQPKPEPDDDTIRISEISDNPQMFVEALIEAGLILECDGDGCGRRVLYENSHEFSTNDDGETLCGSCRSSDRSFR